MRTNIAILLVVALAGCDLTATAEADQVCVTQVVSSQPVPAAPAGAPAVPDAPLPIPVTLQLDVGSALPDLDERGVTTELIAQSIAVTSPDPTDFSGIDTVQVTVVAPRPGLPDIVFTYTRPAGAAAPIPSTPAIPSVSVNLVDYLQGGSTLQITNPRFSGRLPTTAWTPALRTCGSVKVEVDELEAAGL